MKKIYDFDGVIQDVVDGDTVDALVDLGFSVYREQRFRLARIDTPEMHDPNEETRARALKAKQWVASVLLGKHVSITSTKTDKYARYIAEITLQMASGVVLNISDELLRLGLAVVYKGVF